MIEILILNSNPAIRGKVEKPLSDAGFKVSASTSGAECFAAIAVGAPELVLLEWRGVEPVREFLGSLSAAAHNGATRVIVIADQSHREQAAHALELGVEDCMFYPFGASELLARVRAALRRPPAAKSEHVSAGPIVLDKASHHLFVAGNAIELAPTEFRLLRFLLENQGRVFSRQELLGRAWGENVHAGPRTVDVHVRRLRQVLEPHDCADMIQTVRGFGYRFSSLTYRPETGINRARSPVGGTS